MDIAFYKLLHLLGILLVFQGIGASVALARSEAGAPWRRASAIGHGIGMILLLVAGFGMLAKLGIMASMPGWVWAKLVIWLILGALPTLLRKSPGAVRWVWGGAIGLGALAASMALFKPF
jgi:hypothetical protein